MSKTRLLITGAAGRIASVIIPEMAERYKLVLTDIREPETQDHPFVIADITDMEAMHTICNDVDVVLHLAADSRDTAPWESLLPNNVIGAYTIFEAAHKARCQRIVFASSGHTLSGYPPQTQLHASMPVRPANLYGATKVWGEALACFYAEQRNLSCICLRLGWVQARDSSIVLRHRSALDQIITYDDLVRLLVCSIEAPPDLRFGIFHGLSNNRWKRFDISDARAVLGFLPEDDAFVLAGVVGPVEVAPYLLKRARSWLKRHRNI